MTDRLQAANMAGTGRTTRMLRAAITAAAAGIPVAVIGIDQAHVSDLRARLAALSVEAADHVSFFDLRYLEDKGLPTLGAAMRCVCIYLDHAAAERKIAELDELICLYRDSMSAYDSALFVRGAFDHGDRPTR